MVANAASFVLRDRGNAARVKHVRDVCRHADQNGGHTSVNPLSKSPVSVNCLSVSQM